MARVVFVQDLHYEMPGVMTLAAILRRAGHEPRVVIGTGRRAARAVLADRPDVVAFSVMTYAVPVVRKLTRELRRLGFSGTLLAGGIHPTLCPEDREALGVDAICRGEGDLALLEALEALSAGRGLSDVANFCGPGFANPPRPLIDDLDGLPFLDRSIYDRYLFFRHVRMRVTLASRGCPFDCPFCNNKHVRALYGPGAGRWYRAQSPDRALDELEELKTRYSPAVFRFQDDLFGADRDWLSQFLAGFRRRKLNTPFQFQTRAELLPIEMIPELVRTGCNSVMVGLECGDEEIRAQVLGKRIPDKTFLDLAAACRRHGLRLGTNIMFGLPGERLDQALKTVSMNARMRPSRILSDILIFYPKLDISRLAVESGYLDAGDLARLERSAYKSRRSLLRQPDIRAVENVHKLSHLGSRLPVLLPLIRRLAKLPPNPLFDALFFATSLCEFASDDLGMSPVETVLRGLLNVRVLL